MRSRREGLSSREGFTLVELMIVVAVIAVIASIAVPNLLSSRITANEAAALSTLKNLASAQAQCQVAAFIDANGNGAGEFAFFAELSGAVGVRIDEAGGVGTERVSPPYMSPAFANVQGSRVTRGGYVFQMFLPSSTAAPLAEAAGGGGAGVSVSAAMAEVMWSCYAWPASRGNSGNRAFCVNQLGEVINCRNATARYHGTTIVPAGTAAILGTVTSPTLASTLAANATGQDGERWLVVN